MIFTPKQKIVSNTTSVSNILPGSCLPHNLREGVLARRLFLIFTLLSVTVQ